jgi:hypothetical protein
MKNYIYLLFALFLACKTSQTDTKSMERTDFDFIEAPEFNFLSLGQSLDLGGGVTLTKLEGNKAAVTSPEKTTNQQTSGPKEKFKDKSRTEVNINSGNNVKDNSKDKSKDKSQSGIDKSKTKTEVPKKSFLRWVFVFVLLAIGAIWFFYPRIKKAIKPPFL